MDFLITAIYDNPRTPPHLQEYLMDHVNSDSPDGQALFDVLSFAWELITTLPAAHEMYGEDGTVFRQLSDIVVQRLQNTPDYECLRSLVFNLSHALDAHKDEYGSIELSSLTVGEAANWVTRFNQEESGSGCKELSG